jgi:hypothetical protein
MVRTRRRDGTIRRPTPVGWPEGPIDMSLLKRYKQHVYFFIWFG